MQSFDGLENFSKQENNVKNIFKIIYLINKIQIL